MVDELAQRMTELCQKSIQVHQTDHSLSRYMKSLFDEAQGKLYTLPWDDIKKHYPMAVNTFVVVSIFAGMNYGVEGWSRHWMRY